MSWLRTFIACGFGVAALKVDAESAWSAWGLLESLLLVLALSVAAYNGQRWQAGRHNSPRRKGGYTPADDSDELPEPPTGGSGEA